MLIPQLSSHCNSSDSYEALTQYTYKRIPFTWYNIFIVPPQPQVHVGTKLEFNVGILLYIHGESAVTTRQEDAITEATASIVVILLIIIAMMIVLLCWHRKAKRKRRQVCCM